MPAPYGKPFTAVMSATHSIVGVAAKALGRVNVAIVSTHAIAQGEVDAA